MNADGISHRGTEGTEEEGEMEPQMHADGRRQSRSGAQEARRGTKTSIEYPASSSQSPASSADCADGLSHRGAEGTEEEGGIDAEELPASCLCALEACKAVIG